MRSGHEKFVVIFFWSCALITSGAVLALVVFLVKKGFSTISLELIFGDVPPLKALLFIVIVINMFRLKGEITYRYYCCFE